MKKIIFCLFTVLLFSCNNSQDEAVEKYNSVHSPLPEGQQVPSSGYGNSSAIEGKDAYEVMEVAFEGYPSKEKIQPMLEAVMTRYRMSIDNESLLHVANALVVMKNQSKVGVTEMDILKYVYQRGNSTDDLATNIAIAATVLEATK